MATVAFMGSKAPGLAVCQRVADLSASAELGLILCPDDRADDRSVLADFECLAEQRNVPLRVVATKAAAVEALREAGPSVALVHGWYQLIPLDEVVETEFYGFHNSLLPRYRGNAPLVWQIINGERALGVTLFRFSAGMDEGDIAGQTTFALDEHETVADAIAYATEAALQLTADLLPRLLRGDLRLLPQPSTGATYCGLRTPEDGRIDWRTSAAEIHDFVRAQTAPYPGAFTHLPDGTPARIWRTAVEDREFIGVPGAVVDLGQRWVTVACGTGAVRVLEASVDGAHGEMAPLRSLRMRLR